MDIRRILEIDRRFFREYQRQLLRAANTRLGRWYFRLGEFPKDRVFTRFFPFGIEWENEDGTKTFAAKTSDKYANRLKHSLRFVKAAAVALPANLFAPAEGALAMQFLFAGITTSFYPDPNPETTSVDGFTVRIPPGGLGEGWATIRNGAGTTPNDSSSFTTTGWGAHNVSNEWRNIYRSVFLFDTTPVDTGSTISAATLGVYLSSRNTPTDTDATKRELRVVSSSPASNTALVAADYGTFGTTTLGSIAFASTTVGAMNTITLNGTGISHVTKGGISKFGTRIGADIDNTAPTWGSFDQGKYDLSTAEASGTSNDPTLTLTYNAVKTFSETVTMTDTVSKHLPKTFADTVTTSDEASNLRVQVKVVDDTITATDSLGPRGYGKTPVEIVTMTDTVSKSFARSLMDIVTAGDSVTKTFNAVRSFLETVTLTDVVFFWRPRVKPTTNWTDRTPPSTSW